LFFAELSFDAPFKVDVFGFGPPSYPISLCEA
jgi:hypothetical protein